MLAIRWYVAHLLGFCLAGARHVSMCCSGDGWMNMFGFHIDVTPTFHITPVMAVSLRILASYTHAIISVILRQRR